MGRLAATCALTACVFLVAGCVSTNVPRGDGDEIRRARYEQHELTVRLYLDRLVRVNELAMPILRANNELCNDLTGHRIGVTILTKRSLPFHLQRTAENKFGIGSRPVIYIIRGTPAANSELRNGDRLYRINETDIGDNMWSRNTAHRILKDALRTGEDITLRVMRRGSHDQIVSVLKPQPACQSFVYLIQNPRPNSFADGLISDLAVEAFSPAFEREADYVGMYMLARAGLDTEGVSTFWRWLAAEYPGNTKRTILGTHPIHPERFVTMDKTHQEIEAKRRNGISLIPESR